MVGVGVIPGGCRSLFGTAMWTPTTRRHYSRDDLRYETDRTDAEWAVIEPLLPEPLGQELSNPFWKSILSNFVYLSKVA